MDHTIRALGPIAEGSEKPWFVVRMFDDDLKPVDLRIRRQELSKLAEDIKQALVIYPAR